MLPEAQVCNMTTTASTAETTPTTPDTTAAPATATNGQLSTAESICIVIAGVTLVLHVIVILLCAINITVIRNMNKLLTARTIAPITPGVRDTQTFHLGPIRDRKIATPMASPAPYEMLNSQTPAEYEAVQQDNLDSSGHYEQLDRRPRFREEHDGKGSKDSPDDTRATSKSKSSSKTGSKVEVASDSKGGREEGVTWVDSDSQTGRKGVVSTDGAVRVTATLTSGKGVCCTDGAVRVCLQH